MLCGAVIVIILLHLLTSTNFYVFNLKDAETNAEIDELLADQSTLDILDRCGISSVVNVRYTNIVYL